MENENSSKQANKDKSFFQVLFSEAFDLDYGLWQTMTMLFKHPQKVVNAYFNKEQTNYFGPFKYAVFTTAISTFIFFIVIDFEAWLSGTIKAQNLEDGTLNEELTVKFLDNVGMILETLSNQYVTITTLLVMVPSFALFSYLFFRRKIDKFSSHFILNTYFIGQLNFIHFVMCLPLLFLNLRDDRLIWYLSSFDMAVLIYFTYAYLRLFRVSKIGGVLKSVISPLLAYVLFVIFLSMIAAVAALIMTFES